RWGGGQRPEPGGHRAAGVPVRPLRQPRRAPPTGLSAGTGHAPHPPPRAAAWEAGAMAEHTITAIGAVLDCADPEALADFWQAAVGFTVRTGDGNPYVTLSGSELRRPLNHLTFQKVDKPKTVKNRLHL